MRPSYFKKEVQEIQARIKSANERFSRNLEKINEEWQAIKSECTHPEIGVGRGMYICPDCEYNGCPEYPETLSDWDYENYDINIEETRQLLRQLKAKYTREEIKGMKKMIKEKIDALKSSYAIEQKNLHSEWDELKKKCNHSNITSDKFCMDCGSYFGIHWL